jgi:iron complex transport system ATP-binding protein
MALLQRLNGENQLSIVMVLHDLNQAARFSHRLIVLRQGEIFTMGTPQEVLTGEMMREVFQVDGVVQCDPYTHTPTFTPLHSVRGNGHTRTEE